MYIENTGCVARQRIFNRKTGNDENRKERPVPSCSPVKI
jgi:hypothetical protein